MRDQSELIRQSIIRDMSEGVMTVGLDGVISYANPAASEILDRGAEELTGKSFAGVFFEYEENDAFNQTVLDAVYNSAAVHENIVPYYTGKYTKQLHVRTSFLRSEGEKVALIVVLSDISELTELRDAIKAMEKIKALNDRLELRNKLLSETFGRFLSDDIVRQLLDTPDGLNMGGRKRSLTIMMSDLRGFTALSERMEAQKLILMLNHYLGEMTEIIQRNEGTIIEFIGDGIMALFGAPNYSEKHAENAVRAAVEMQRRMREVNDWNTQRGLPTLEMGIGINTGDVIVGTIGSERRTKYGVVGSNVNLCGRIESYTVRGEILISPQTRDEISVKLEIAAERPVIPKGVKEPLTLSLVAGIGDLSCRVAEEKPVKLASPIDGGYLTVKDKHTEALLKPCRFTALCGSGAVIEAEEEPELFENLELEINKFTKLFAKVTETGKGYSVLRFTSIPEGFEDFVKQSLGSLQ